LKIICTTWLFTAAYKFLFFVQKLQTISLISNLMSQLKFKQPSRDKIQKINHASVRL